MQVQVSPHDMHIFVCQHSRDDGRVSCHNQGDVSEFVKELKRLCKEKNLTARVSGSGCLGPCEKGPNVMVYPDKLWFHGVSATDLPALVDHLVQTRLRLPSDSEPGSSAVN